MKANKPTQLSAVIITKNEEKNIGRCITSLQEVADEIIVVDSFSTDKTKEICEQYKLRFEQRAFKDYSDQKNYANKIASHNFILSIDADEALSEQLKTSILKMKEGTDIEAFYCHRLTNYCGQWIHHSGWYPDTKLRLFDRRKAQWQGKIHETITLNTNKTSLLQGDLLHYSFYSISDHSRTINKFSELAAKDLFAKGKRTNIFKILFAPFFTFFKSYLLKKGILDGYYGFVIAIMSSYYSFLKYAKLFSYTKSPQKQTTIAT